MEPKTNKSNNMSNKSNKRNQTSNRVPINMRYRIMTSYKSKTTMKL